MNPGFMNVEPAPTSGERNSPSAQSVDTRLTEHRLKDLVTIRPPHRPFSGVPNANVASQYACPYGSALDQTVWLQNMVSGPRSTVTDKSPSERLQARPPTPIWVRPI